MKELFQFRLPLLLLAAEQRIGVYTGNSFLLYDAREKISRLNTSLRVLRERQTNNALFSKSL